MEPAVTPVKIKTVPEFALGTIWQTTSGSSAVIIPKQMAECFGFNERGCRVVLETRDGGIFIQKIKINREKNGIS